MHTKPGPLSKFQVFKALFYFHHPYLNALMIKDLEPDKTSRLWIFFCRISLMLAVVSVFGRNSPVALGTGRLLADLNISLDIYLLIVPFVTFIPIAALLTILLSLKPSPSMISKPKLAKCIKAVRYIGIFLLVCISAGSIYVIISVSSNSSDDENI